MERYAMAMSRASRRQVVIRTLIIIVILMCSVILHYTFTCTCSFKSSKSDNKRGFILSFRFYEQQTQGLTNVLQLQCLASSLGLRTVEPFLTNSMFTFPFPDFWEHQLEEYLRLGDLVDMQLLHKNTSVLYPPISSWEHFLEKAPRNIITNCIRYRNPPEIPVPKPGFNFRSGCTAACHKKFRASVSFLSRYGFKLVRNTCSNFIDYAGSVSVEEFSDNIFGKFDPDNVTVIINEFRGFFGLYRLPIRSTCGISRTPPKEFIFPSSKIIKDAEAYNKRFLRSKHYVSVIARIERIVLHLHHEIDQCAANVKSLLNRLAKERGLSNVFLGLDVGKFGSHGANQANLLPQGKLLFNAIHGPQEWTFKQWEDAFSTIASSDNPAYVANLQRTIAANGECLIMVGGGGFQGQARDLYERFHPVLSHRCVYRVCNSE